MHECAIVFGLIPTYFHLLPFLQVHLRRGRLFLLTPPHTTIELMLHHHSLWLLKLACVARFRPFPPPPNSFNGKCPFSFTALSYAFLLFLLLDTCAFVLPLKGGGSRGISGFFCPLFCLRPSQKFRFFFFFFKSGVSQKIWVSQKSYVVNRRDKEPKIWVSSDFSLSFTKISVFFCSEFLAK